MSNPFTFEISLTVLNHLGRQLYRNFITILGEAISNAWDADADNVWIAIDRDSSTMSIVDDGIGMTGDSLQDKFLKVGYSKRGTDGNFTRSPRGRPFIGAKGIGKLAMLSCADRVSVVSQAEHHDPIGCMIDNSQLDEAIRNDQPAGFPLPTADPQANRRLYDHCEGHGTALFFQGLHPRNNQDEFLRRALALSFRFALVDPSFAIHYNGDKITIGELQKLAEHTEFVWATPGFSDDFLNLKPPLEQREMTLGAGAKGFIATADMPSSLAIYGTGERVGIDLFVNGRLRERDLISHFPTSQRAAQYVYGQVHLDDLDGPGRDIFTSSREGIVEGDPEFNDFIERLRKTVQKIIGQWDELRDARGEEGDPENTRKNARQRAADLVVGETVKGLEPKKASRRIKRLLATSKRGLAESIQCYSQIYVLENLMRTLLSSDNFEVEIPEKMKGRINEYRDQARKKAEDANLTLNIRRYDKDLWYCGLDDLLDLSNDTFRKSTGKNLIRYLSMDKARLSLLRNIVMHTADLTNDGHNVLDLVVKDMEAKIKKALADMNETPHGTKK